MEFDPKITSTPLPPAPANPTTSLLKKRHFIKGEQMNNESLMSPAHKKKVQSTEHKENDVMNESEATMEDLFAFDNENNNSEKENLRGKRQIDSDSSDDVIRGRPTKGPVVKSSSSESDNSTVDESHLASADNGEDLYIDEDETTVNTSSNKEGKVEIVEDSESEKEKSEADLILFEDSFLESIEEKSSHSNSIQEKEKEGKKSPDEIEFITMKAPTQPASERNPRGPIMVTPPVLEPKAATGAVAWQIQQQPLQVIHQKRLFGGQMTDERMDRVQGISNAVINSMHKSLSTIPDNVPTDPPKGLRIELMTHQKTGLTWLLWREQQAPPSGILADDMGLGKTLSMISLILYKKVERMKKESQMEKIENDLRRHYIHDRSLLPSNGTLVIAPASLIFQWEKEVHDRVKSDKLDVHVYHGPKSKREISAHRLARFDIVITTYDMLATELKGPKKLIGQSESDDSESDEERAGTSSKAKAKNSAKALFKNKTSVFQKIAWERIILDEAHEIRNKNAQKSKACCSLEAVHRWCLTGTPIHNKLADLHSLIRFMRVSPFDEEKGWKEFIDTNTNRGMERLNTLVKSLLLRRCKNQICTQTNKPLVDLKPKTFELVTLDLQETEMHCYSIMFAYAKQQVSKLLHEADIVHQGFTRRKKNTEKIINPFVGAPSAPIGDNFQAYSCILVLLLRLRQACVHMSLTKNAVDLDAFKEEVGETEPGQNNEAAEEMLEMSFANLSLEKEGLEAGDGEVPVDAKNKAIEKVFEQNHCSTKVAAVLARLDPIIAKGDKCVIVSQWATVLQLIELQIKKKGIKYTAITGSVKTEDRQFCVDNFNKRGTGPSVMLLTLTAGGVGLNLIGGNHLFMVDLHWNPALEQQACDRIYRMGQTKDVFVHKFICNSTIEQRVMVIQGNKTKMATSVLEGAASKKLTKLTREELVYLFELDKRPNPSQQQAKPVNGEPGAKQPSTSKPMVTTAAKNLAGTSNAFTSAASMMNYGGGFS